MAELLLLVPYLLVGIPFVLICGILWRIFKKLK